MKTGEELSACLLVGLAEGNKALPPNVDLSTAVVKEKRLMIYPLIYRSIKKGNQASEQKTCRRNGMEP